MSELTDQEIVEVWRGRLERFKRELQAHLDHVFDLDSAGTITSAKYEHMHLKNKFNDFKWKIADAKPPELAPGVTPLPAEPEQLPIETRHFENDQCPQCNQFSLYHTTTADVHEEYRCATCDYVEET